MGGLSGLSGLTGIGGTAGGVALTLGFEYQDLLFTSGGSPASAVYGKLDASFLGNSATLDATSGLPTATAALGTLESIWGSGNVEASAVNKGYRLKFVGELAQYDIIEATLTPSTAYTLNTGTSVPSKTSQRNYTAGVTGSAEVVTLQLTPNDPGQNGNVSDSLGNEVDYDGGLTQYTTQNNVNFAVTSGSGTGTVEFTAGSNGPKGATGPIFNNNNTSISPFSVTPGVADVAEVLGQVVIAYTGAAGYFTFADGFTAIAIPVTSTGAEIKAILNGATGYNASKVDTVTVGASTITIDYASGESPAGTVTISGRTGAAVTATLTTVQDGATPYVQALLLDGHWEAGANTFSDNGTTPASSGLIYRWNKASGSGPDLVQATSGNRGSLGTVSGKPAMQFDDTARKYTLSSNIDVASNGSFVVMVAGSFVDLEDQLLWYSATNNSQIRVCENGNARTISASTSATPAVLSPSTSNFVSPCVLTWVVSSGAIEFFIGHTSLGTASFDVSAGFRFEDFGFLPAVNLNGNIYGLAIKKAASGDALSAADISYLIDYMTGLMP